MLLEIVLLLVGFSILIKGADFLVDGASSAAKKFGISNLAIGLTVVAFGTSMPELVVSLLSALDGNNDASFGNVIGSNTFNLLFILGISGLIYPLVVHRNTVKYEVPLSLLAAIVLYLLVNDRMRSNSPDLLSRIDGIILLVLFGCFLYYIYRTMKSAPEVEQGPIKLFSTPVSVVMVIAGLLALIFGGRLVVNNAISLAHRFDVSEKLIGLTILAAGTSLPELATSAVAAYRKNTDIAIGNVVGSNIFNILLILGITSVVQPISYNSAMNFDLKIMAASTVLLMVFMFTMNTRKLDRWEAFLMLGGYITYTLVLIQMG